MGAWGTGLFSDDSACDVRDEYRVFVADGLDGPQATDRLLQHWAEVLDDPDEGPVFWCALAATQWRTGRLEPRVRDRALEVIRSGQDLGRWGPADRPSRAAVLAKLAEQLNSPQRAPVRIRPPLRTTTPLRPGDAVTFQLGDGHLALLRVAFHVGDDRDNHPVVEVADWLGRTPPDDPAGPPARAVSHGVEMMDLVQRRKGEYPVGRLQVVGQGLNVQRRHPFPALMIGWSELEDRLNEAFGLASER